MHTSKKVLRNRKYKNRRWITFLCICSILSFGAGWLTDNAKSADTVITEGKPQKGKLLLSGKTFVVDAGHGGSDPGTLGLTTGVYEADVNLRISLKLKHELEKLGANVVMTRTEKMTNEMTDSKQLPISNRGKIIENANADMVLSIHQNFNDDSSDIRGVQILYRDSDSARLADEMQDTFNANLNTNLCCIKDDYGVLKFGNQPGIIVECGFLSNRDDEKLVQTDTYQKRLIGLMMDVVKKQICN